LKLFPKQQNHRTSFYFGIWGHNSKKKETRNSIFDLEKKESRIPILPVFPSLSPPSVPISQQQGSGSTASEKLAARVNSSNCPS
jgi:hypothetical protein